MTNSPISRNDLFVTIDFQHSARVKLAKHFVGIVMAEHDRRGQVVTVQFATKQAYRLISVVLDELFIEAEDDLGCLSAGECMSIPEWTDERIAEAVSNAEGWYRGMLDDGYIKLPKRPAEAKVAA